MGPSRAYRKNEIRGASINFLTAAFVYAFGTERNWSNAAAILTILIGICLLIIPFLELRNGVATGGLFYQNHKLANEPELFWQLLDFHLALVMTLIIGGILLLIFRPPKAIKMIEIASVKTI